jgi:SAM-dependent methyltransferase
MDPMPLAGGFAVTAEAARAMPRYPLAWVVCQDCGLVNVYPDIPDEVIFGTYSYAASTVPALVRHHARFADILAARYGPTLRFLEVGGNDGVLLDRLPETWERWNIDPSDVARKATGSWALVEWADVPSESIEVVSSSNALAHFTDIAGTLDEIARVLRPDGELWVEVHDLDATLELRQWDTIYHEHKVEWSHDVLVNVLAMLGFEAVELWRLPLHGGLLRLHLRKSPERFWHDSVDRDFDGLREAYADRRPPPLMAHSAAYGAAARATVYLNQMSLPIDYVVDASPLRAGKFVPGLGIPVLPPEVFEQDQPETTLITAWNHATDIRARHPGYEGWVSAW